MKVCVLFPGYGSQYVGMAKELYDNSRVMQEFFEEASACVDINFIKLCFASSDLEIGKITNAYTALFLVSCGIYAVLKDRGLKVDLVSGHNLGEYAALYAAGCFSFPDGIYLLNKYAVLYQEFLSTVVLSAIRIKKVNTEQVQQWCSSASDDQARAYIALYLEPDHHIVIGQEQAIARIREYAPEYAGAKLEEVGLEVGLHDMLMEPVAQQFEMYLEKVDFKDLAIPQLSSTDGALVMVGSEVRERIMSHMLTPLHWDKVLEELHGYDLIIEVGPGTTLASMVKRKYSDTLVISVNKWADIALLDTHIQKDQME